MSALPPKADIRRSQRYIRFGPIADIPCAALLPHTLAAASESDGGKQAKITFERVIVWPDGHREIEGAVRLRLPSLARADESGRQAVAIQLAAFLA
jgi:hypothetical protein